MGDVCDDFGVRLVEFNGEDDHVHLLIDYPATVQLTRLVNSLKGVSSRILRKEHRAHVNQFLWGGHFWSRSYYCGTTGGANLDIIKRYVQNQNRPV